MSSKMGKLTFPSIILIIVISYEKTFCLDSWTSTIAILTTTSSPVFTATTEQISTSETKTTTSWKDSTTSETKTTTSWKDSTTSETKTTTSPVYSTTTSATLTTQSSEFVATATDISTSKTQATTTATDISTTETQTSLKTTKTSSPSPSNYSTTEKDSINGVKLSLEEKQKRNGITSAVICVGSLILIGIAYLSSFVDRPTEKVPQTVRDQINQKSRYQYDSEGRIVRQNNNEVNHAGGKKISFGNASQITGEERPGTSRDKEMIEMTHVKPPIYNANAEKQTANVSGENRKRGKGIGQSGWDILANNPKFFDDYQPHHTNTNNIEND